MRKMFKKRHNMDSMMIFDATDFWIKMGISREIVLRKYKEYLGEEKHIRDREKSLSVLKPILQSLQEKMRYHIEQNNTKIFAGELYKILDRCWAIYLDEKEARTQISTNRIFSDDLLNSMRKNSVIELNIISAINVWLENCVLLQTKLEDEYQPDIESIDPVLCVELCLYGSLSRAVSMLAMSGKLQEDIGYYGIDIVPDDVLPIDVYKEHPVIYYNPIINGNQSLLNAKYEDLANADNTDFGKGFLAEYGVSFLLFLRVMRSFQQNELVKGKYACIQLNREQFNESVNFYLGEENANGFYNAFVLNQDRMKECLGKKDDIIYKTGVNKYRHELRPFIAFEDGSIYVAYAALEQSMQIWCSYFLNGGVAYSDLEDQFSASQEKRNKELSDLLIDRLRNILRKRYNSPDVDEINVDYKRIFGPKNEDYGDFDIVFYDRANKELFLIEAKYFSDSLNNSGMINDYVKLFKEKGYYYHCRRRYELVLNESDKVKIYLNESDKVKTYLLFVSSKPIEMKLQDRDKYVTFLSLANIEDFIDNGFISEDGKETIKPVKII